MRTLKRFGKAFGLALSLAALGLAACGGSSSSDDDDDITACPQGQHFGDYEGNCVPEGTCSPGYYLVDGIMCWDDCGLDSHDGGDAKCVDLGTCSPGYRDGGDGECVLPGQCSPGYHDGGTGTCVLVGECSPGFHVGGDFSGLTCVKVGTCAPGHHDGGDGRCMTEGRCLTGYHIQDDGTCLKDPQCPAEQHDFGGGTCTTLPGCNVGADYHDDGMGYCVISPYCAPGFNGKRGGCQLDDVEWVSIPAGTYTGPDPMCGWLEVQEGECDPTPETRSMSAFKLTRTPITIDQYMECVNEDACTFKNFRDEFGAYTHANDPVHWVTWDEADAYCKWLGGRLPTAQEWEYAATHDGQKQTRTVFPWGNANPVQCLTANYKTVSSSGKDVKCQGNTPTEDSVKGPSAVGTYSPAGDSPLGLVDMIGNVAEWTSTGEIDSEGQEKFIAKGNHWDWRINSVFGSSISYTKDGDNLLFIKRIGIRCARDN